MMVCFRKVPCSGSTWSICSGNVNSDSECSGPLVAGYRNCPSRLGTAAALHLAPVRGNTGWSQDLGAPGFG